ncbi:MAG: alpha-glucosidase [Alphaproteobacteria bacterium]
MIKDDLWWKGAVIYQIYPRSFYDGNNDGIGDLKGVTAKIDYLASLGIDAIWLSPIFKSPMKDFGYDVSDYRDIDPLFGSIDDFKAMLDKAHSKNIKVLLDFVPSHTSDKHPWFEESRQSRDNPKSDWYMWADAKDDGTPPNNWMSIFGGVAWEWDSRRRQYYLHNFLKEQPDLNWNNPEVVETMLSEMEFWLKLGVDGFRLDVISFCINDKELRDNPPYGKEKIKTFSGQFADNPYYYQKHIYDNNRPEMIAILNKIRKLVDSYGANMTVGEISSDDPIKTAAEYCKGKDRLHMGYNFELLSADLSTRHIQKTVERLESLIEDGWPCWSFSNHDTVRVRTRWGKGVNHKDFSKVINALLLSLRGTVCVYQGDELGIPQAFVPYERLQDPYGITFWPAETGRDGCRTPLPWSDQKSYNGFSMIDPWLPAIEEHKPLAVNIQEEQKTSILNHFRQFLKRRNEFKAMRNGEIEFFDAPKDCLIFARVKEDEKILTVFNLSSDDVKINLPKEVEALSGFGFDAALESSNTVNMPAWSAFFGKF